MMCCDVVHRLAKQTRLQLAPSLLFQRDLELSQQRHEPEICKYPRKGYGKAEEGTELSKELKLAEEEGDTCYYTRNHSVEDTNTQVTKSFGDSFVGVTFCYLICMRKVNDVVHRKLFYCVAEMKERKVL